MSLATSILRDVSAAVYDAVLGRWLWQLFRHGPLWLGCWSGLPDVDVCSRLAGASAASDWHAASYSTMPSARCTELIQRTFMAYVTLVHTALYAICLYAVVRTAFAVAVEAVWPHRKVETLCYRIKEP